MQRSRYDGFKAPNLRTPHDFFSRHHRADNDNRMMLPGYPISFCERNSKNFHFQPFPVNLPRTPPVLNPNINFRLRSPQIMQRQKSLFKPFAFCRQNFQKSCTSSGCESTSARNSKNLTFKRKNLLKNDKNVIQKKLDFFE